MCDYSDESEWRKRSGLEPLPKAMPAPTLAPSIGSPAPSLGSPNGGVVDCATPVGGREGMSDEVINLLSDSDDD